MDFMSEDNLSPFFIKNFHEIGNEITLGVFKRVKESSYQKF